MFDAVDEVGAQALRRGRGSDIGETPQQLAIHHTDFPSRQVSTQAIMRTRSAEADVIVGVPTQIEPLGMFENSFVAVG